MKNYENPSIFVKVTAKKQWHLVFLGHGVYTPCPRKKGATDFFAVTFTNIDGFS